MRLAPLIAGLVLVTTLPSSAAPGAKPTLVIMDLVQFKPRQLTVEQGTTIRWWNIDRTQMQHNVVADDGSFDSGRLLRDREDYVWVADKVGTFPYSCTIHIGMTGTVTVTPKSKG